MADPKDTKRLIEEARGSSGRYEPMRTQRVSEFEKGFREYLAAQQGARESLLRPSPTLGGMAKGAAGALAGYAAQVPGVVGDILSLYEDFKPDRAPNLPEWLRAIPTTERLQEYYLPKNASPELQAGVTGGNLFALGQGVAALPKVVAGGAKMAGAGGKWLGLEAMRNLDDARMTGEGVLGLLMSPARPNFMFIGPYAETWNSKAALKAMQMERAGKSPEEIWEATKTFKGADGNWRQEISDQSSQFMTEAKLKAKADSMKEQEIANKKAIAQSKLHPDLFPKELTAAQKALREQTKALNEERTMLHGPMTNPVGRGNFAKHVLEHSDLYKAYPELADVIIRQGRDLRGFRAATNIGKPSYPGDPVSSYTDMDITKIGLRLDPRSSALHELQHVIQQIEGWAPGGNIQSAFENDEAHEILKSLQKSAFNPTTSQSELQQLAARQYYLRLAGEAEARATQARQNMSNAQRQQVPPTQSFLDMDNPFPMHEHIVKPPLNFTP
jgi:hypothetical protein